jgi:hypothetical protein
MPKFLFRLIFLPQNDYYIFVFVINLGVSLGMESAVIELTKSAIREHRLDIRACGGRFFPSDAFGSSSKKGSQGNPIVLLAEGLSEPIKTDIPSDNRSGRRRWFFRERGHIGEFMNANGLVHGDRVVIRRVRNRTYELITHKRQLTFIDLFAGIGGMWIVFNAN